MKKFILSFALISGIMQAELTHESVMKAIIDSDFDRFEILLTGTSLNPDEHKRFLELADHVIQSRNKYAQRTIFAIAPSKELYEGLGFEFMTIVDICASIVILENQDIARDAKTIFGVALLGAGIGLGYLTIKKLIDAYNKPYTLYENALKIKQLLLSIQ